MYQHILLPTDGTILSESAIRAGVELAKSLGARVTGLHVIVPFHVLAAGVEMVSDTQAQYEKDSLTNAERFVAVISTAAKQAGVTCDCVTEQSGHPFETIIAAAGKRGCDLIVMASHGRRGVRGLLLGSETNKVLTHTRIPVLVLR